MPVMQEKTYTPPTLIVDSVVLRLNQKTLEVLLIKRGREPFAGAWALPGGYCAAGETTIDAMTRILHEKAGIGAKDISLSEQLYTYDTVAGDPRGHAVSVVYMDLTHEPTITESKNTHKPCFFDVTRLPVLAFDHANVIQYAVERLCSKIGYSNIIASLLPEVFTLSQLQSAFEAITAQPIDKRNFRKKLSSMGLIKETGGFYQDGAHRPARLYTFKSLKLEMLPHGSAYFLPLA